MATIAEQSTELRLATFRLSRRIRAEKSDEALSDGQIAVLGNLFRNGTQTLGQLAERERVSAPSMNRTVNCSRRAAT
jgi:DNA-binding MarR family transcriptional regulator